MGGSRKLLHYFKPYRIHLLAGVVCIIASVGIGLMVPIYVGQAIDELRLGVTWAKLTRYALLILGVSAASGVFLFLQRRLLIGMSRNVEYDLRQDLYAHLQHLPLSFFQVNRIDQESSQTSLFSD